MHDFPEASAPVVLFLVTAMILCSVLQGFGNHIKKDHNMWDYVYYSFYLDSINTSNHTALQKYVDNLVRET